MEKALNVLKELCLVINFNSYWKPRVDEAIAELEEAMKHKTCEGCKHGMYGVDGLGIEVECGIGFRCTRGQKDRHEPKDTQC